MYDDLLDESTQLLYRQATADPSLAGEIRLARARLGRALAENDDNLVGIRFDTLTKLVLAQAKIGADPIDAEGLLSAFRQAKLDQHQTANHEPLITNH
jgi:hypothetical protein